jgi:hypothetical protein
MSRTYPFAVHYGSGWVPGGFSPKTATLCGHDTLPLYGGHGVPHVVTREGVPEADGFVGPMSAFLLSTSVRPGVGWLYLTETARFRGHFVSQRLVSHMATAQVS